MAVDLSVYIEIEGNNVYVGKLSGTNTEDTVFTYATEYVKNKENRPISISLPLTEQPFDVKTTRTYFEGLLRNYSSSPLTDQLKLWNITVFNYLAGNTDNHIKNLALLYGEDLKSVRLAPAYDMISTMVYQSSTENMSFAIGGTYKLTQINRESFAAEAKSVGLGAKIAMRHFDDMVSKFPLAIETAAKKLEEDGESYISEMKELILQRGGIANYLSGSSS